MAERWICIGLDRLRSISSDGFGVFAIFDPGSWCRACSLKGKIGLSGGTLGEPRYVNTLGNLQMYCRKRDDKFVPGRS